jgi:hypothetical protein
MSRATPNFTFDPELARLHPTALAKKLLAIAAQYVPPGWTVIERKTLSGACNVKSKRISAPRPITRDALHIFLHECAHAHLHPFGQYKPRHVEEYEADQWANARMREHGIPVPRWPATASWPGSVTGRREGRAVWRGATP